MASEISLRVNGTDHKVTVDDPEMPLLYALRDDLRCAGPNSAAASASAAPARCWSTAGAALLLTRAVVRRDGQITTLEGLGSSGAATSGAGGVHRRTGGAMRLLHQRHDHDRDRAARAESAAERARRAQGAGANLCRCGSHVRVLAAVLRAAAGGLSHEASQPPLLSGRRRAGRRLHAAARCLRRARRRSRPTASTRYLAIAPDGGVTVFAARSISAPARAPPCARSSPRNLALSPARIALIEGDTALTPDQGRPAAAPESWSAACRSARRRRPRGRV